MSSDAKITLGMIVKDNPEGLEKCLKSVEEVELTDIVVVDTGSRTDKCKDIAAKYGARVYDWKDPNPDFFEEHGFISDFGAARTFCFDKIETEWGMFLDSDDELIGGRLVRQHHKNAVEVHKVDTVSMQYVYARDESGNIEVVQVRERIWRPKQFEWRPFVHEIPLPKERVFSICSEPEEVRVEHEKMTHEQARAKSLRDLTIIDYWLKKTGDLESRMWKFRGRHLMGLGRYEEAIQSFQKHLDTSGWKMDVYLSKCDMADCYRLMGLNEIAADINTKCIRMFPKYPNAYAGLALSELLCKNFEEAVYWAELGMEKTAKTQDVYDTPYRHLMMFCTAKYTGLSELGRHEEALEYLKQMEPHFPDKAKIKGLIDVTNAAVYDKNLYGQFIGITGALLQEKDEEKLEAFLKTAPKRIHDMPALSFMQVEKPKYGPSVAIASHNTDNIWGPDVLDKGIGGSEKAVIFLAPELAKKGAWVDVFANVKAKSEVGENEAKHRWYVTEALRNKDPHDLVMIWRDPPRAMAKWNAKKVYLWMHDMPNFFDWNQHVINSVDRILVLSEFHKKAFEKYVPKEKLHILGNGLNPADFVEPKNDPKRVIFASNPNRGLINLLKIWKEIHERTGAMLHIYYGFTEWHKRMIRSNPMEQALMFDTSVLLKKTPGVVDHGMVSHKEIYNEYAQSGIWAYPTEWPETSCMVGMEAQSHGCIPVCSRYGALDETVQYGFKIGPDSQTPVASKPEALAEFKERIIWLLENPQEQEKIRKPMIEWARKVFSWDNVADRLVAMMKEDGLWEPTEARSLVETLKALHPQPESILGTSSETPPILNP